MICYCRYYICFIFYKSFYPYLLLCISTFLEDLMANFIEFMILLCVEQLMVANGWWSVLMFGWYKVIDLTLVLRAKF